MTTMDRRGSVCEKHGEYSATGICRWCDPVKASSPPAIGMLTAPKEPVRPVAMTPAPPAIVSAFKKRYGADPLLAMIPLPAPKRAPLCTYHTGCGAPAAWLWRWVGNPNVPHSQAIRFCEGHQKRFDGDRLMAMYWQYEALSKPVASEGPKARSTSKMFPSGQP